LGPYLYMQWPKPFYNRVWAKSQVEKLAGCSNNFMIIENEDSGLW